MPFPLPGTRLNIRLFDRVDTVDSQYDIFDVGVQHANGDIDSLVVGGSFATAKRWAKTLDDRLEANSDVSATNMQIDADFHAVKEDLPFVNVDGTEVPTEQQRTAVTV